MNDALTYMTDMVGDENFQGMVLYIATDAVSDAESSDAVALFGNILTALKTAASAFDENLKEARKANGTNYRPDLATFRKEGAGRPKSEKKELSFSDLMAGKKK